MLVVATGTYGSATYALQDGTEVEIVTYENKPAARITSSYVKYVLGRDEYSYWNEFIVRYGSEGSYTYYHLNNAQLTSTDTVSNSGIYLRFASKYADGTYTALCTQYVRDRILIGTKTTDRYYFYDGVFTFALSDASDTISPTWDGTTDTFSLGTNDATKWTENVAAGASAIVSYLKPITTSSELSNAILNGKKLVIMSKQGGTNSLVSLSSTPDIGSWRDGDDICSINAKSVQTAGDDLKASLKNAFENGSISIDDINSKPSSGGITSTSELLNNWDNYYLLYFGSNISDATSLNEVETNYLVYGSDANSTTTYLSMAGGSYTTQSVSISSDYKTLTENRDETKQYNGFFFATVGDVVVTKTEKVWGNTYPLAQKFVFTYYYITSSGEIKNLGKTTEISRSRWSSQLASFDDFTASQNNVSTALGSATTESNGTNVYTVGDYSGPFFYKFGDKYYSSFYQNTSASSNNNQNPILAGQTEITSISGGIYTCTYVKTYTYNSYILKDGDTYTYYNNGTGYKLSNVSITEDKDTNGRYKYSGTRGDTTYNAVMAIQSTSGVYQFSDLAKTHYLRIERRKALVTNYMYTLWCATDDEHDALSDRTVTYLTSKDANVSFNTDGSCNIRYTYTQDRYLNYNGTKFNGTSDSTSSSAVMYIYSYEGSQKTSYGHITFEPSDSNGKSLSADEYLLWPNSTYKAASDVTSSNVINYYVYNTSTFKYEKATSYSSSTTYYTKETTSGKTVDSYTVKQLQLLSGTKSVSSDNDYLTAANGWKNAKGQTLTNSNLNKKFIWGSGTSAVSVYNLWNGDISLDADTSYVRAPIGSTGEEAYIPTGCVAFRVNSASTDGHKIRVIVAVPQTEYYYGETDGSGNNINPLNYSKDYYFCMWQIKEVGSETNTKIGVESASVTFELPRSNTYVPGSSASGERSNYVIANYNGTDYRSYLNGDVVLVAYEFYAYEVGVYLLGCNQTCEIVYFSADATASSGQDGTSSYKMGTIDYVYDYTNTSTNATTIITVDKGDSTGSATRDYTKYYYNSMSLLYTDNDGNNSSPLSGDTDTYTLTRTISGTSYTATYANINDFAIYVRRILNSGSAQLNWHAVGGSNYTAGKADAAYIQFVRYSLNSDTINRGDDVYINQRNETN